VLKMFFPPKYYKAKESHNVAKATCIYLSLFFYFYFFFKHYFNLCLGWLSQKGFAIKVYHMTIRTIK